MKFFMLALCLSFSFHAVADLKGSEEKARVEDERYFEQQKKNKIEFEKRKKAARKSMAAQPADSFSERVFKDQGCANNIDCFKDTILKAKNRYKHKILKTFDAGSRFFIRQWNRTENIIARNFHKENQKKTMSAPPEAGGIFQMRTSSGSRPFVDFSTDEEVSDPDGTVETIIWDFGDGTSQTFSADDLDDFAFVRHIYPAPGHYTVTLTLIDDNSDETTYSEYADVAVNQLPIPTFTMNTNAGSAPLAVEIYPTAFDPEGRLESMRWRAGDGASVTRYNLDPVYYTYNDPGTYELRLEVRDQDGARMRAFADIFVGVTPPAWGSRPSLIFESSDLVGVAPHHVTFDASKSFDIDGTVSEYEWDFGDYNSTSNFSNEASPQHVYSRPGTYFGRLAVRDAAGGEAEYFFEVHIEVSGTLASHITAIQWGNSREIEFDGDLSSIRHAIDNNHIYWDFGDGNGDRGMWRTHEYTSDGTYTVSLTIKDVFGQTYQNSKSITVSNSNDSPVNNFNISNRRADSFEELTFDGSGSTDPTQSLALTHIYDFGDGEQGDGSTDTHAYSTPGYYNAVHIVTNTRGLSRRRNRSLVVRDGSIPYGDIQYTPKVGNAPLTVDFSGSRSSADGAAIVGYQWKLDGDQFSSSAQSEYTFDDPGTYFVELIVTDDLGNMDYQFAEVIAVDSGSIPPTNTAPTASFTFAPVSSGSYKYEFDASGSSDPENDYLLYEWKVDGVLVGNFDFFDYRFPESNIYQVSLTVYDEWGASHTSTQAVDLSSVAEQQIAFDYAPIKPIENQTIRFGAERSVVPGSTIVSYDWDFGDTNTSSGLNVTHAYAAAGTYTVQLTLTDSNSNTFSKSQYVTVDAANSNPNLTISARDVDFLVEAKNSSTYWGTTYSETVHFSVRGTYDSNTYIKDAVWNFGNGETGFGADVEYTYTRPGTYMVSVTGYDANGLSSTASLYVAIPQDCKRLEGQTECLTFYGLNSNILPFSSSSWTIERTGNFSSESKHFPKNWIHLKALDGSDDVVDLSAHATVNLNEINISKQTLIDQNIDFSRPYKLVVQTVDSTNAPIFMEMPKLYFGAGKVRITTAQSGVRLTVVNPSAQFKKFVDLGSNTVISLSDLPLGASLVIAEKDGEIETVEVDLLPNKIGEVAIDFSLIKKERKIANLNGRKKNPIKKDLFKSWQNRERWASGSTSVVPMTLDNWPAEALSLCGELPPFTPVQERALSVNQEGIWPFTSDNPNAQSSLQDLPITVSRPVRLSCGIASESLNYGHVRWKYKDGPQRCWQDSKAHWYWDWYLKNLKYEDDIVQIHYQVEDQWTGEIYRNVIVTSASAMRQAMGKELTEITQKVGIVPTNDTDWAYRQNFDIIVPPHFKRPRLSFALESSSSSTENDFYAVACDVVSTKNSLPKAVALRAVPSYSMPTRKVRNGLNSLQGQFKYFPVHSNTSSSSAVNLDSDAGKAQYQLSIRYYNQSAIDWQEVEVEFQHNGVTHTETYALTGSSSNDTEQGIYRRNFEIDTADLAGIFSWNSSDIGSNTITLKLTPKGEDATSTPVSGLPMTETFVALFDVKTIESEQSISLCANGYFGTHQTTFAQNGLVKAMKKATDEGADFRCSNMSLPFGGLMDVSGIEQDTYRHGLSANVRTFNDSDTAQDNYDGSGASLRKSDVEAYMDFSAAALVISQIVDEYGGGNPTDKKKLLDFCKPSGLDPKAPCDDNTVFADLNHDMVLQICQWHSNSGTEIDGCPADYLEEAVRFSDWVGKNIESYSVLQQLALQPVISSGLFFDVSEFQPVQAWALMYGAWPDGKPIWKVSGAGTELTNSRVEKCHESQNGCRQFKNIFSADDVYVDSMEIMNGWRL